MKRVLDALAVLIIAVALLLFLGVLIVQGPQLLVNLLICAAIVWAILRVVDFFDDKGVGL